MSLRDVMNKRPGLSGAIAAAGVLAIACVIWMQVRSLTPDKPGTYYSADDGVTYFADAPDRVTPFDYHGKQAVRAHVFRGADGKKFVGYLERITADAAAIIQKTKNRKPTDPPPTPAEMGVAMSGREFKRPGDKDWVPLSKGALVQKITAITTSDGAQAVEVE